MASSKDKTEVKFNTIDPENAETVDNSLESYSVLLEITLVLPLIGKRTIRFEKHGPILKPDDDDVKEAIASYEDKTTPTAVIKEIKFNTIDPEKAEVVDNSLGSYSVLLEITLVLPLIGKRTIRIEKHGPILDPADDDDVKEAIASTEDETTSTVVIKEIKFNTIDPEKAEAVDNSLGSYSVLLEITLVLPLIGKRTIRIEKHGPILHPADDDDVKEVMASSEDKTEVKFNTIDPENAEVVDNSLGSYSVLLEITLVLPLIGKRTIRFEKHGPILKPNDDDVKEE